MPNNTNYFTIDELVNVITSAMQNSNNNTTQNSTVNGEIIQREGFAINSKYYGETLTSGEIFNPYLNRRFISSQFIRLMKQYDGNVTKAIKKTYDYKYMINHFKNEVNKLALLERIDKIAFDERKNFLPLGTARNIFTDYCSQLRNALANSKENKNRYRFGVIVGGYIPGYRFDKGTYEEVIENHRVVKKLNKSAEYKELLNRIKHFESDVKGARTYQELANILNGFKFIPVKNGELTWIMVDRFMAAGSFYTLKNLINFEDIKVHTKEYRREVNCTNATESLAELRRNINKEGYVLYAILKYTIEQENYSI